MIALNKTASTSLLCLAAATAIAAAPPLLNDPVDVSGDFRALENSYYLADKVSEFDPATHAGKIVYQRAQYRVRHAFDNDLSLITAVPPNEFPENQYAANPALAFSVEFISPRALRIKMTSGPQVIRRSRNSCSPAKCRTMTHGNMKRFPAATATPAATVR